MDTDLPPQSSTFRKGMVIIVQHPPNAINQKPLGVVEAFRKSENPIPSENEAIRQIINAWLEENGHLKP